MRRDSISGVVPFIVATVARSLGADAEALLEGSGIGAESPPPADEHIEVARYFEVWHRAMQRFDAAFPLRVASAFTLEDNEVFGFLAMSCATLGDAFDRTLAYNALYCSGARFALQVDASASRVIWYPWPGDLGDIGYRAAMDYAVADMENAVRRLGTGNGAGNVAAAEGAAGVGVDLAAHGALGERRRPAAGARGHGGVAGDGAVGLDDEVGAHAEVERVGAAGRGAVVGPPGARPHRERGDVAGGRGAGGGEEGQLVLQLDPLERRVGEHRLLLPVLAQARLEHSLLERAERPGQADQQDDHGDHRLENGETAS